ncbi:hypothetical protein C8035_v003323 [Colletotrichum spinosum]|uniref:Uncharacterized protein n=1 Tax=Colletotrichum spinosum TaxID=1347390 RepID=A0A4R8QWW8_9PEZI|nr:hypothetical protein C8035_v003323 [Colletotrichum spinosum]
MNFLLAVVSLVAGTALGQITCAVPVSMPALTLPYDEELFRPLGDGGFTASCGTDTDANVQFSYRDGTLRMLTNTVSVPTFVRVNGDDANGLGLGDSRIYHIDPTTECAIECPDISPLSVSCFTA